MIITTMTMVFVVVGALASHQIKCKKKLTIAKRDEERPPVETMMIKTMKTMVATLATMMSMAMITRW